MKLNVAIAQLENARGAYRYIEREWVNTVLFELRAEKRKVREMWRAFCPNCKYHHSNGAGIACRDNNLKTPAFCNCPLLKSKEARNGHKNH